MLGPLFCIAVFCFHLENLVYCNYVWDTSKTSARYKHRPKKWSIKLFETFPWFDRRMNRTQLLCMHASITLNIITLEPFRYTRGRPSQPLFLMVFECILLPFRQIVELCVWVIYNCYMWSNVSCECRACSLLHVIQRCVDVFGSKQCPFAAFHIKPYECLNGKSVRCKQLLLPVQLKTEELTFHFGWLDWVRKRAMFVIYEQ